MKVLTIKEAAEKLAVDEKEAMNMCKNGYLNSADREGELPGITEKSVCEFLGEEYVEEKEPVPKKRGRQPKVLQMGAAAEMLDITADEVTQMAFDEFLEEWQLPGSEDMGVTKRSVQGYMKEIPKDSEEEVPTAVESNARPLSAADVVDLQDRINNGDVKIKSMREGPVEQEYEYNDNFDMSEERELNEDLADIHVGETKHVMEPVEEISVHDIIEYEEEALAEFKKQEVIKNTATEEMVTMSRVDFEAHVSISAMRAEIGVYRSLKSFERRA